MSQLSNYGENKIADFFRGQGITLPTAWHIALGSATSDSSFTEITGLGVTRASVTRSLANWAGTQGAGTTLASTGTSHTSSNNSAIDFGTPSGSATASHVGFYDNTSGGNVCHVAKRGRGHLPELVPDHLALPRDVPSRGGRRRPASAECRLRR